MLFNSYQFIFIYLPIVAAVFFALNRARGGLGMGWLVAASLGFYVTWDNGSLAVLLGSITFNFLAAKRISHLRCKSEASADLMLGFSVIANLAVLAYFKYANFFIDISNGLTAVGFVGHDLLLPLGISFFTFTQIAFLVDVRRGFVVDYKPVDYALFVTYFPHLVAGPILHHRQMIPQFKSPAMQGLIAENIVVGFSIFIIGLAKKVLVADNLGQLATPIFASAANGHQPMLIEAWVAALAYSFQLYFDFSGYSDMAIGLSLMFNVRLPENFDSPYKAASVIDFWRRWHMTLSVFLRDYLYVALGGNRRGTLRRYGNILLTMVIGGLWHGAGWTFILWGALHGFYLVCNHAWRAVRRHFGWRESTGFLRWGGVVLTFILVVIGWVIFRADSVGTATAILGGMVGANGLSLPPALLPWLAGWGGIAGANWIEFGGIAPSLHGAPVDPLVAIFWFCTAVIVVWGCPNVGEIFRRWQPSLVDETLIRQKGVSEPGQISRRLTWRPNPAWAVGLGVLFVLAVDGMSHVSPFLYFRF